MIRIRPITAAEIAAFVDLTPEPDHRRSIALYLDNQFAHGTMRPDWCFVADLDGSFVGRLAYWGSPMTGIPSDILFFEVPWEHEAAAASVGTPLFHESLAALRSLGATSISYVLDTPPQPPQWQPFPEQRAHLLISLGFRVTRETNRFAHDLAPSDAPGAARLVFRSQPEVGTTALLGAIEQVSVATLDRLIQQQRTTLGASGAAQKMLSILQDMTYDPSWWQLAYTPTGAFVGLVMPTAHQTVGTIGYIGIVPEQRGKGYGYDLLTHGTAILRAAGITTIRADADRGNLPMARAFRRAGYQDVGTRRAYQVDRNA